jgi:hypothetical protein
MDVDQPGSPGGGSSRSGGHYARVVPMADCERKSLQIRHFTNGTPITMQLTLPDWQNQIGLIDRLWQARSRSWIRKNSGSWARQQLHSYESSYVRIVR